MQIGTNSKHAGEGRFRPVGAARTQAMMLFVVAVCASIGAGPVAAQSYRDLNEAVNELTEDLASNGRLEGKRVLVNAHDFFEEGTGRNLPLSATLRERFITEFSTRGVQVFALPEGSEDDMVILQGVWRELSEPSADSSRTRTIHLTVKLIERTRDGQRVLPSEDGRVEGVDARLLTPNLASWGRHVVKQIENRVTQRQRRMIHVGEVVMDGVPEPGRVQRYLVRRWLVPAFAQSRLFGLVTGDGEQSEGTIRVDVFMESEQVEIVLDIRDGAGRPIGAADVEMAKGVFPARYFPSSEAKTPQARQGFMLRRDLGVTSATELDGASVCIRPGSNLELNLANYFESNGMEFYVVAIETNDEARANYLAGRCDLVTMEVSRLAAMRSGFTDPGKHVILPETIDIR